MSIPIRLKESSSYRVDRNVFTPEMRLQVIEAPTAL